MAEITISITKSDVYSIAEGISVTISQHNGGTPSYEQLWASASESRKIDIYYRQAVSDLERRLMLWVSESHAQFGLTEDGGDYELTLSMSQWWPLRLEGLLANKVQDYLVNAVTAGWLNDFEGISVKADYAAVAASDLMDIREILHQRSFEFGESSRADDSDGKPTDDYDSATSHAEDTDDKPTDDYDSATSRAEDTDDKPTDDYDGATSRAEDTDDKPTDDYDSATSRAEDTDDKPTDDYDTATSRGTDTRKDSFVLPREVGFRKKDDVRKSGPEDKPFLCKERTDRHKDNDVVCQRSDWTDMSGTGIAYRNEMPPVPTRPMMGMGYTPAPSHCIPDPVRPVAPAPCGCRPACPPRPAPDPRKNPRVYPEPPYHAKPPHYPPFPPLPEVHPDGMDWSDAKGYDQEQEEMFINSHVCGQPGCHDPFGWADDEEDNNS